MPILNHRALCVRPTRPPVLPPVTCRPWCRIGDGHPRAIFADDQACLSEHPGVDLGERGEVGAYAHHSPASGLSTVSAYIEVVRGPDGRMLAIEERLTAAEARAFAAEILAAADAIDPPARPTVERTCADCGAAFAWDESPDDDRCAFCADVHAWFSGEDLS